MKNTKLENGEVIEKILEKLWWRSNKAVYSGERTKEKDILSAKQAITNALNQQREQIVGEIEKYLQLDWKPTEGYGSEEEKGFQKGIIAEQGQVKRKLKEFLTKLEK